MGLRRMAPAAALGLLLVLAGCGGSAGSDATQAPDGQGGYGGGYGPPSSSTTSAATALATADSSLGTIVVDGTGLTVYMFDSDTKGGAISACTGTCLVNWPPVTTDGQKPALDGVTGTIGLIAAPGGKEQVTLDGWPLYRYAGDKAPGDVNGQGVGGTWWVLAPDGSVVRR